VIQQSRFILFHTPWVFLLNSIDHYENFIFLSVFSCPCVHPPINVMSYFMILSMNLTYTFMNLAGVFSSARYHLHHTIGSEFYIPSNNDIQNLTRNTIRTWTSDITRAAATAGASQRIYCGSGYNTTTKEVTMYSFNTKIQNFLYNQCCIWISLIPLPEFKCAVKHKMLKIVLSARISWFHRISVNIHAANFLLMHFIVQISAGAATKWSRRCCLR
jgi:hypothetical protein